MFQITLFILAFVLDPISARDDTINDSLDIENSKDKSISNIKSISYDINNTIKCFIKLNSIKTCSIKRR